MTEVPITHRKQSIDLQSKAMDWFLFDWDLRDERVNVIYHNLKDLLNWIALSMQFSRGNGFFFRMRAEE